MQSVLCKITFPCCKWCKISYCSARGPQELGAPVHWTAWTIDIYATALLGPIGAQNLMTLSLAIPGKFKGCKLLKWITWPWSRHFQGRSVVRRLTIDIAYKHTKFDFSRSDNIWWVWNSKIGHVTLTTPFSGTVCHRQAGTCYHKAAHQIWSACLHPFWKYERHRKMSKMGWLGGHPGSLKIASFDRAHSSY